MNTKQILTQALKDYFAAYRTNHVTLMGTAESIADSKFRLDRAAAKKKSSLETIQQNYPVSRLENLCATVKVRYGVQNITLRQFAYVMCIPVEVAACQYDIHGCDAVEIMHQLGRKTIIHFNCVVDKIEVGNFYQIPWELVDEHEENLDWYIRLITMYSQAQGFTNGILNRQTVHCGTPEEISLTKAVRDNFEAYMKKIRPREKPEIVLTKKAASLKGNTLKQGKPRGVSASEYQRQLDALHSEDETPKLRIEASLVAGTTE